MKKQIKMLNRPFRFSKVFISILLSLIVIMLPPTAAAVILGINSINAVDREAQATNESILDSLTDQVNFAIGDALDLTHRLSGFPEIYQYAYATKRDYYSEYEIMNLLHNSVSTLRSIEECYLYLPQFQAVISATGGRTDESFFQSKYGGSIEAWREQLGESDWGMHLCAFPARSDGIEKRYAMVRMISNNNSTDFPTVVVAQLDEAYIKKRFKTTCRTPEDILVINSSEYGLLCTTASERETEKILALPDAPAGQAFETIYLEGGAYTLAKQSPRVYPIEVFYATPQNALHSSELFTKQYILFIICFCVVTTSIFCAFFATRNYRPVRKLYALIGKPNELMELRNEYDAIENAMRNYIRVNSQLLETFDHSVTEFQEMFLVKLLHGMVAKPATMPDSCKLYSIDFPDAGYALILFEMLEDSQLFHDEKLDERERKHLTRLIVQNIASELFSAFSHAYVAETPGFYVVICNFPIKSAFAVQHRLEETSKGFIATMHEHFYIDFNWFISGTCSGIDNLPSVYQQTVAMATDQKMLDQTNERSAAISPDYSERCIALIREQYGDSSLSLTSLAEALELSPVYLSRYFKQQTGVGLLDYVHRYRLTAARELMQSNPNILLKEVAAQTGFGDVQSLIRVFKKLEGITPGQYKANLPK